MRYKREEGFRYSFKQPLPATITMYGNGPFKGELIDLSLGGAKIKIAPDVEIDMNYKSVISFVLNDYHIKLTGEFRWEKPWMNGNLFGILFDIDKGTKVDLLKELKEYAKRSLQESKKSN
jgi:hypothetical protein